MNKRNTLYNLLIFVAYLLVQVLFFDNMVLYGTAFCFPYVGFLLLLPLEIGSVFLISIAFFSGIGVDIFYNSLGINASVSVMIAFLRPYWLDLITPRGGYEDVIVPTVNKLGLAWFLTYILPLVFLHHIFLFTIEAGGFIDFLFILKKSILSSIYTSVILVTAQFLFYNKPS